MTTAENAQQEQPAENHAQQQAQSVDYVDKVNYFIQFLFIIIFMNEKTTDWSPANHCEWQDARFPFSTQHIGCRCCPIRF